MTRTHRQGEEFFLLAIDPGKDKCGVALVRGDKRVVFQRVIRADGLIHFLKELQPEYAFQRIIVGNGTRSRELAAQLREQQISSEVALVDEAHTTLQARKRFFADHPPRGLRRLLPRTLLVPERDYDDYAAILLAERYLESQK